MCPCGLTTFVALNGRGRSSAAGDELVDETGRGVAVGTPSPELRRMPEPQPVEPVVRHLGDEPGRDGHPVLRHARKPSAARTLQPPGRATFEPEAVRPRVLVEWDHERPELGAELLLDRGGRRRDDARVVQHAIRLPQAKEDGGDAAGIEPYAGHDAVGGAVV